MSEDTCLDILDTSLVGQRVSFFLDPSLSLCLPLSEPIFIYELFENYNTKAG